MRDTSWGNVATWYDEHLKGSETFQRALVIPGVLRMLGLERGESVLDIACGQGQLAKELAKKGARVTGVDASKELIALAKRNVSGARFFVDDARKLSTVQAKSFQAATIILALQNIDRLEPVFQNAVRVLTEKGRLVFIITHPCFRIPRQSGWGYDEQRKLQYRRVDSYISEMRIPIQMHPGQKPSQVTWTFHRPLSAYVAALTKAGFVVEALEEWVSERSSDSGPRARAENRSRAEIPLFMAVRILKK